VLRPPRAPLLPYTTLFRSKVGIAGVLGGLVGIERELANRPAGLRTHAILAAAAAFIVGLAELLVGYFVVESPSVVLRVDPIRIIDRKSTRLNSSHVKISYA